EQLGEASALDHEAGDQRWASQRSDLVALEVDDPRGHDAPARVDGPPQALRVVGRRRDINREQYVLAACGGRVIAVGPSPANGDVSGDPCRTRLSVDVEVEHDTIEQFVALNIRQDPDLEHAVEVPDVEPNVFCKDSRSRACDAAASR